MKTNLRHTYTIIVLTALLSACSGAGDKVASGTSSTMNAAANAALTPLSDVGIKSDEIPARLEQLVDNPYSTPKPLKCKTVQTELDELDALLGPDLDAPKKAALSAGERYSEAGADIIQDSIVGFVRSQTSIIPFRSIVRRLTGAAAHEKAIAKAKEAGKLRRAYLKGLASAKFGKSCNLSAIITVENKASDSQDSKLEVAAK